MGRRTSNDNYSIAALLYGEGDFVESIRLAFNFGWDCDHNAATAATIIGVIKGRSWMNEHGWDIKAIDCKHKLARVKSRKRIRLHCVRLGQLTAFDFFATISSTPGVA